MKKIIKEYLTFTKSERNGILVLISLIIILVIVRQFIPYMVKRETIDFSQFEKDVEEFQMSVTGEDENYYTSRLDKYIEERYDTLKLFKFNPNATKLKDWRLLGFTDKQIDMIDNYLAKGGKFLDKRDFMKMYGLRKKQYDVLHPYILLPEKVSHNKFNKKDYSFNKTKITLFDFDPNNTSEENWLKLGLSKKQINVINNYINKGGSFSKPEDFKKMYCIRSEQFDFLQSYINIPKEDSIINKKIKLQNEIITPIDINTASKDELIKVKGIGEFSAKGIIKYRKLLGGFIRIEQVLEVYGIKKETFDKFKKYLKIENNEIEKININFADFKELIHHPYLNYEQVKAIVNFRTNNGSYQHLNDLIKNNIILKKDFDRLKSYFSVN